MLMKFALIFKYCTNLVILHFCCFVESPRTFSEAILGNSICGSTFSRDKVNVFMGNQRPMIVSSVLILDG